MVEHGAAQAAAEERERERRVRRQRRAAHPAQQEIDLEKVAGERDRTEDAADGRGDGEHDRRATAPHDLQRGKTGAKNDQPHGQRQFDASGERAALPDRRMQGRRVDQEVEPECVFRDRDRADQRDDRAEDGGQPP